MFKKASTQNFVNFDDSNTNKLVQQLVAEISQLEQKLSKLHTEKQKVDFLGSLRPWGARGLSLAHIHRDGRGHRR